MKQNLLPDMKKVKMTDRHGEEFTMWIELRHMAGRNYVFFSDSNQLGASRVAQDAMFFIRKVTAKLNLDAESTVFYRHIYHDQMGSLFGRFQINWSNAEAPSYRFQMLTNIDDLQGVKNVLTTTETVDFTKHSSKRETVAA